MPTPTKTYTNADIHAIVKGIIDPTTTALNGMLDKVPPAMKGEIKGLHDKFNVLLGALGPIEQVPAAQEIGWAMERLVDCVNRLGELKDGLMAKMGTLTSEYNGLQAQIGTELLKKSEVAALLADAEERGRKSMLPAIVAGRKKTIETCGLPHPSDEILNAEEAIFTARLAEAEGQAKKLTDKGLKKGTKSGDAWLSKCWQTAAEFAGTMTLLDDLKVGTGTPGPEPLLGNVPPGGGTTGSARKAGTFAGFA
jgi:hypothetical protein